MIRQARQAVREEKTETLSQQTISLQPEGSMTITRVGGERPHNVVVVVRNGHCYVSELGGNWVDGHPRFLKW